MREFQRIIMILLKIHINKNNKYPINLTNIENANSWNFKAFKKYLERNNIHYHMTPKDISDIFIKLIKSMKNKLIKEQKKIIYNKNKLRSNFE